MGMKESVRWNLQDGIRTIEARWNPQRNLHNRIQMIKPIYDRRSLVNVI